MDFDRRFFGLPDFIHIYEGCGVCITDRGGIKAANMTIILSMTTKISYLIVNNGFLIDKLINKHEITQIKLVQYMLQLGLKCLSDSSIMGQHNLYWEAGTIVNGGGQHYGSLRAKYLVDKV